MDIERIICVEDNATKYADIRRFLQRQGFLRVDHTWNAEKTVDAIAKAQDAGKPYSLLISDMHFDFYGTDDHMAGEKLLHLLREKGYDIPVLVCSSQNWNIEGTLGTIFYHPDRDWEWEAQEFFHRLKKM